MCTLPCQGLLGQHTQEPVSWKAGTSSKKPLVPNIQVTAKTFHKLQALVSSNLSGCTARPIRPIPNPQLPVYGTHVLLLLHHITDAAVECIL